MGKEKEESGKIGIARIAKALVMAQAEMPKIKKSGYNQFDKYPYSTLEDYVDAVRPVLKKHGLAIIASVMDIAALENRTTKKGGTEYASVAKLSWTLLHDSGQSISGSFGGEGQDRADKGLYKAVTGGRKYLLAAVFNLATSDDPESDEEVGNAVKNQSMKEEDAIAAAQARIDATQKLMQGKSDPGQAPNTYRPAPNPADDDKRSMEDKIWELFKWVEDMAQACGKAGLHPDEFWPQATNTEFGGKIYHCKNHDEARARIEKKIDFQKTTEEGVKGGAVFIWQRNVEQLLKKLAIATDGEHGEKLPWDEEDNRRDGND